MRRGFGLLSGVLVMAAAGVAWAAEKLPFVVYGDDQATSPWISSGYMGNFKAIVMDDKCATNPHAGKTCLKVDYKEGGDWGGVVWQTPANDWGDQPGGFDLTGAKKLTFWARGEKDGTRVKFGYGLVGADKKFHDTSKAELEVTLTADWKQYSIDLSGKDLSNVKTGFYWTLAGQVDPITFYLDDVQFE